MFIGHASFRAILRESVRSADRSKLRRSYHDETAPYLLQNVVESWLSRSDDERSLQVGD